VNYFAIALSVVFAFVDFFAFLAFFMVGAAAGAAAVAGIAAAAGAAGVAGVAGAEVCAAAKAERENRPATTAAINFFIFFFQFGIGLIVGRFWRITLSNAASCQWLTGIK
jgi:hypothetical protein